MNLLCSHDVNTHPPTESAYGKHTGDKKSDNLGHFLTDILNSQLTPLKCLLEVIKSKC